MHMANQNKVIECCKNINLIILEYCETSQITFSHLLASATPQKSMYTWLEMYLLINCP